MRRIHEEISRYIDNRLCAITAALSKKIDDAIGSGGGGGGGEDTTAPAMTKEDLATATGITRNSVYLTDGTGFRKHAYRNINDTTSPASPSTIIVDGDGVRWYIMSDREFKDGLLNNYSPFPI